MEQRFSELVLASTRSHLATLDGKARQTRREQSAPWDVSFPQECRDAAMFPFVLSVCCLACLSCCSSSNNVTPTETTCLSVCPPPHSIFSPSFFGHLSLCPPARLSAAGSPPKKTSRISKVLFFRHLNRKSQHIVPLRLSTTRDELKSWM